MPSPSHGAPPSSSARPSSAPAAASPRPCEQVVGTAERVPDPMLAAMPDQQDARVIDDDAALRTLLQLARRRRMLRQGTGIPMRTLHRPGDDMLQPAEDREALAGLLRGAEALVAGDGHSAPAATLM